jgi:hypothetical protein
VNLSVIQDRSNSLDYKIVHLQRKNTNPTKTFFLAKLSQIFTRIIMGNTCSNFWSLEHIIISGIKKIVMCGKTRLTMYCLWEQFKQKWIFTEDILKGNNI